MLISVSSFMKFAIFLFVAALMLLFGANIGAHAQPDRIPPSNEFLLLHKEGTLKRQKFYVGDELNVSPKGTRDILRGTLEGYDQLGFVVNGVRYQYSEVHRVYSFKGQRVARGFGKTFIYGAGFFTILSLFNQINNPDAQLISPLVPISLGTGLLLYAYPKRIYRLDKNWRLEYRDVSPK